jgi:hypothetical protein
MRATGRPFSIIVLSRKSIIEISKGELPKSKPCGALPWISPTQIWPIPASRSASAWPRSGQSRPRRSFLDGADHHDLRRPVRQGNRGSGEGAENVNNHHRTRRPRRAFEKAVDRNLHKGAASVHNILPCLFRRGREPVHVLEEQSESSDLLVGERPLP